MEWRAYSRLVGVLRTTSKLRGKSMRSVLIATLLLITAAGAAAKDYEEVRELKLDTAGIRTLNVDNSAGSIDIVGVAGLSEIRVTATIVVPNKSENKARRKIEKDLVLLLDRNRDTAVLNAYFEHGGWFNFGESAAVSLEIRVPEELQLFIDDGSGSIDIEGVLGDVEVDDGSGSITLANVGGEVEIDDGSGSISVRDVGGDLFINDGSGSIKVRGVAGSVIVDDGSGGIDIHDVEKDLTIVDDGSGGLQFSNIGGRVEKES